jgi:hypothetical protein
VGLEILLTLFGLSMASSPPGQSATAPPLVEVFASNGFINEWHIIVSRDGVVRIVPIGPDDREASYRLTASALGDLRALLEREHAENIGSGVGQAIIDGPERSVRVGLGDKVVRFTLYSIPRSLTSSVRTDKGRLGRAVRICEGVRLLGPSGGTGLASCVTPEP